MKQDRMKKNFYENVANERIKIVKKEYKMRFYYLISCNILLFALVFVMIILKWGK